MQEREARPYTLISTLVGRRDEGVRCRMSDVDCKVYGVECRVWSVGFRWHTLASLSCMLLAQVSLSHCFPFSDPLSLSLLLSLLVEESRHQHQVSGEPSRIQSLGSDNIQRKWIFMLS